MALLVLLTLLHFHVMKYQNYTDEKEITLERYTEIHSIKRKWNVNVGDDGSCSGTIKLIVTLL